MTKFRRYASGDKPRFTASQLNALNQAALAHSQGKSQTLQAERLRQRTGNHFPVANGTEDNLPAFSVLELQRALIEPDTDVVADVRCSDNALVVEYISILKSVVLP